MEGLEYASANSQSSAQRRDFATEALDLLVALNIDQIEPLDVENIELGETDLTLPDAVREALDNNIEGEEDAGEQKSPLVRLTSLLLEQARDSQERCQHDLSSQTEATNESERSGNYATTFWKEIMKAKPKAILQLKTLLHCLIAAAAPDSTTVSEESHQILEALRSTQAFFCININSRIVCV
eukprot:gb/GECG01008469.1/.p1 GENE.gb/GECG01008469.1/~~gb/GECG01008469.1/.p1  ORF type:complete len:183 (+),score=30.13 gb/GECG01008469.1/:1-549(+)